MTAPHGGHNERLTRHKLFGRNRPVGESCQTKFVWQNLAVIFVNFVFNFFYCSHVVDVYQFGSAPMNTLIPLAT
jgi:hypothetical protein